MDCKNKIFEILQKTNQTKLITAIENSKDENQVEFLIRELNFLNSTIEGGLENYYKKGVDLIKQMENGDLDVPNSITKPQNLQKISLKDFEKFEEISENSLDKVGFVLVAGGFGERLGSKKIKISLMCEIVTQTTFLQLYLAYIEKFQMGKKEKLNLFIMTSDQTHEQTLEYLKLLNYDSFVNIEVKKQDKVPCFQDLDMNFDFNQEDLSMNLKPHGHGDIHTVLKNSETMKKWKEEKSISHLYFFQDTNPFSLASLPVILGVSLKSDFKLNYLAIKRKPGEPYGTLITDQNNQTYNIEYNVFSSILKEMNKEENLDNKGFSEYPGNTNCFLIEFDTYLKKMEQFNQFKEIANPKLNPDGSLKSPFRLEVLMQDVSHLFGDDEKVGVTYLNKVYAETSAKNDVYTGKQKQLKKQVSQTIIELENDLYFRNYKILKFIGVQFDHNEDLKDNLRSLNEIQLQATPRIFIHPSLGVTIKQLKDSFSNCLIEAHQNLYIFLKGRLRFVNCKFTKIALWCENSTQNTITFNGLELQSKNEVDMLTFVETDDRDALHQCELRGYMVKNLEKLTKIIL